MKLGRGVTLGKDDDRLAQGSSRQKAVDSKERRRHDLLCLMTNCRGETWESERTHACSLNNWTMVSHWLRWESQKGSRFGGR